MPYQQRQKAKSLNLFKCTYLRSLIAKKFVISLNSSVRWADYNNNNKVYLKNFRMACKSLQELSFQNY